MPLVPITDPTIAVALRTAAGPGGCIDDPAAIAACLADWRGRFTGQAAMVLQPGTTQAVADVIRLCARHGIGVVPQGGNTGLVGGSVPRATAERPQILLSASRLRNIISIDTQRAMRVLMPLLPSGVVMILHFVASRQQRTMAGFSGDDRDHGRVRVGRRPYA